MACGESRSRVIMLTRCSQVPMRCEMPTRSYTCLSHKFKSVLSAAPKDIKAIYHQEIMNNKLPAFPSLQSETSSKKFNFVLKPRKQNIQTNRESPAATPASNDPEANVGDPLLPLVIRRHILDESKLKTKINCSRS